MLDIQHSLAQPDIAAPVAIRRVDYRAPAWLVPTTRLEFTLDPSATRVIR
jgi:aminopeptidase N